MMFYKQFQSAKKQEQDVIVVRGGMKQLEQDRAILHSISTLAKIVGLYQNKFYRNENHLYKVAVEPIGNDTYHVYPYPNTFVAAPTFIVQTKEGVITSISEDEKPYTVHFNKNKTFNDEWIPEVTYTDPKKPERHVIEDDSVIQKAIEESLQSKEVTRWLSETKEQTIDNFNKEMKCEIAEPEDAQPDRAKVRCISF